MGADGFRAAFERGEPLADVTVVFRAGVDGVEATALINSIADDFDLNSRPWYDDPRLRIGTATKAALGSLARSIATTYGKQNIRANCVCPGSVWPEAWQAGMAPAFLARAENTRLTPRLGVPEDIGRMVAFLLSDKASYVTGQTIMVDGGGTVHQPWVRMD